MKNKFLLFAVLLGLTIDAYAAATIQAINQSGVSCDIYVLLGYGNREKISEAFHLNYQDTTTLRKNYTGEIFAYYVEFYNEHETNSQYRAEDRDYWKRMLKAGGYVSTPSKDHGAVYFTPIDVKSIPLDKDTVITLHILESDCHGDCWNGKGKINTSCDSYNGYFLNGIPNGEGDYVRQDTTYEGNWLNASMNGEMTITFDGYKEVGTYRNNKRYGEFKIEYDEDRGIAKYNYEGGVWDQLQEYSYNHPEPGKGRQRSCKCYSKGRHVRCVEIGIMKDCSNDLK